MTESENVPRNYLKGIMRKKWYSYLFLVGIFCFFASISSMFTLKLIIGGIVDYSEWDPDLLFKLVAGYNGMDGILGMIYTYGNRLGLLFVAISFFFGGLVDYTLPKEVRRSLIIGVGVALGGYFFAYLLFTVFWL